jgi:polar amino acid transport system substrate-binding protein
MKRAILACAVLAATAAAPAPAGAGASAPPPTEKAGVLTVGLSLPTPGFQIGAVRGTRVLHPKGMEVALAEDIAARLGLKKVRFYNVADFHDVLSPARKPYDLALAEVAITPAHARNVAFSVPYYPANQGVLVRAGLSPRPRGIADLRRLRLCAQTDTIGAKLIRRAIRPTSTPQYSQTPAAVFQQLQAGRCDAAIYDAPLLGGQKAKNPNGYGPIVGQIVTGQQYGIVFEKGSPLRIRVDAVLRKLVRDRTIRKLATRYLTTDIANLPIMR